MLQLTLFPNKIVTRVETEEIMNKTAVRVSSSNWRCCAQEGIKWPSLLQDTFRKITRTASRIFVYAFTWAMHMDAV